MTCESALSHAEPVKRAKLSRMVLVTRHGCRAPFDGYGNYTASGWQCDSYNATSPHIYSSSGKYRQYHVKFDEARLPYPPSCRKADLTFKGMDQHYKLGQFYRSYLIDELHFLPETFDSRLINFRSSEADRCIASTKSFIQAFYPPQTDTGIIQITTGTDAFELLHPRPDHCRDFSKVYTNWINSSSYQALKNEAILYLQWLVNSSGLKWDDNQWLWIGDWLYTIGCCGSPLPDFISQEQLDFSMRALEFFTLNLFSFERGVAGASVMREIFRIFDESISGENDIRFSLMTSHDVTIVSLLDILGYKPEEMPTFRSHMAFELWERNDSLYLRVVLNGKVIGAGDGLSSYSDMKANISEYLKYCPELG